MSTATDGTPRPSDPVRRRSVASTAHGEDGGDYCRICRGEGTTEQPLFYPCKCSGSIKFVHQDCLMEWLSHSQKKYCELCKTPFRFTKLYDQSMPETVPFPLFFRQVAIHSVRAIGRWLRYSLVVFVWLFWLPWTIRQIWRGLFWIADGSWMTAQELKQALATTSPQHAQEHNADSLVAVSAFGNVRLNGSSVHTGPLSTVFSVLSPSRMFLAIGQMIWRPARVSDPVGPDFSSVENMTSLSTAVPRQPSLLSEIGAIKSVTRYPLVNNAVIDVLEGQLVCILIIAAFILIFLIREWVINQQPIPNMPDPDQRENAAQPAVPVEQPRPIVRRRRRGLRRLAEPNPQLGNHNAEGIERPQAAPRPRRAATDNNIVLVDGEGNPVVRPPAPPRAASLVAGLQQMEETARQLGMPPELTVQEMLVEDVQSPPLQRGAFDDMTHVRRNIEESLVQTHAIETLRTPTLSDEPENIISEDTNLPPNTFMFGSDNLNATSSLSGSSGEFTFRLSSQSSGDLIEADSGLAPSTQEAISEPSNAGGWISVNNDGTTLDPVLPEDQADDTASDAPETLSTSYDSVVEDGEVNVWEKPDTIWGKVAKWLWHTDEYVPPPPVNDVVDDTDIVQDLDAEAPFVPARNVNRGNNAQDPPVAGMAQGGADVNNQLGFDPNDPNAIDDAEDIEGILELIGMEGPVAGMIQNIIFSVFLITLTLSASIWCPYIWGKIALLFLANPVGVFIKAPLYLISRIADVIVDMGLFALGIIGIFLIHLPKLVKLLLAPVYPASSRILNTDFLEDMALNLSEKSVHRLEKTLSGTLFGLRPDLPTFSMQSHHAMRVFQAALSEVGQEGLKKIVKLASIRPGIPSLRSVFTAPVMVGKHILAFPTSAKGTVAQAKTWFNVLSLNLKPVSFADEDAIDYSLVSWSTQEKVVCILLGYTFFAIAGFAYLKIMEWIMDLKEDEKVDGIFADVLRQAGGVLKVVIIIGIEMIVFPLYCGIMLDLALLPLFEGASPLTRLNFLINSPVTALFVHWFIGTCYMFHFALFVSMCRKIMRKGVLYFIRDPDDPSFHPVRDVLERPVATQLGKIAFSAFIYGGLLVVCLGGVILGISYIGKILPIHWSSHEPRMAFPSDIIFFNMMLPFILRKVEVSTKISKMYEWWFRGIASGLRLTNFLFGAEREEERRPARIAWRSSLDVLLHDRVPLLVERDAFSLPENPFTDSEGGTVCVERLRGDISPEILQEMLSSFGDVIATKILPENDCGFVQFADVRHADIVCKSRTGEFTFQDGTFQVHRTKELDNKLVTSGIHQQPLSDGIWVRAPATDSVRIPKGTLVFLEVNEKNERLDGKEEIDVGLHGRKDDRFRKIYIPPNFRARIAAFIVLVWIFAATTGILFTLGPLLVGREVLRHAVSLEGPPNDLYAFTIGLHVSGVIVCVLHFIHKEWQNGWMKAKDLATNTREMIPRALKAAKYVFGLAYMIIAFGVVLPFTISLACELYIHIPLYTYLLADQHHSNTLAEQSGTKPLTKAIEGRNAALPLVNIPVVYLLQTWTLGFIYLRVLLRIFTNYPHNNTQAAVAVRGILRNGILHPDIKLATRAFVLPVMTISIILLTSPIIIAKSIVAMFGFAADSQKASVYRHTYPCLLAILVSIFTIFRLNRRIEGWRIKIRDEVYLIGERLHNFQNERVDSPKLGKGKMAERQRDIFSENETDEALQAQQGASSKSDGLQQQLPPYNRELTDVAQSSNKGDPTETESLRLPPQQGSSAFPTRTDSLAASRSLDVNTTEPDIMIE